jgi:hypothetical protein
MTLERTAVTLFLSYCIWASISVQAQQYVQISAEIELTGWRGDETDGEANAKTRTISVGCIAGTNEWRVEGDFIQGAESKWLFDGTNVYERVRSTSPTPTDVEERVTKSFGLAMVPFEVAKSNVTIRIWASGDGHPLGYAPVNLAWLAFCSGTYLKRDGRLVPLPVGDLHHTRDRFAYSDKTETFGDECGLPRTVELFTSKALYQASVYGFDQEYFFRDRYAESNKRIVSSLQEGVLTFHYAVSASTNFLGWNFPLRFEFFQNGRKYQQNGDSFCRGVGRVKSIRPSAKPEGLFVPSMQQTVVDWRFRDASKSVDAITYRSTNGFASPTNDPILQEKFAAKVQRMSLPPRQGRHE